MKYERKVMKSFRCFGYPLGVELWLGAPLALFKTKEKPKKKC